MKLKHLLLFRVILYSVLALFGLILALLADSSDDARIWIGLSLALVFGFLAYRTFQQIQQTDDQDVVYGFGPGADAPVAEQVSHLKRNLYLALVAFPVLTWIITSDLNALESGVVESVRVWAPVAFLYEQFGYWVAVLTVPVLGVILLLLALRKINALKTATE